MNMMFLFGQAVLGNIYLSNQHNQNQLNVCEKILKLDKPLWGSCWGLQVIAYLLW